MSEEKKEGEVPNEELPSIKELSAAVLGLGYQLYLLSGTVAQLQQELENLEDAVFEEPEQPSE